MGCGLCPEETQRPFGGHRPGLRQGRLHQVRARSQAAHVTAPWWPGLSRGVVSLLPPLPPAGSRTVASTRPSSLRGVSTPTRTIWMGSSLPSSRNSPMPSRRHRKVKWCWSSAELAGPALAGCFPRRSHAGSHSAFLLFQMKNLLQKQQLRLLSRILSRSLRQKRRNLRDQTLTKSRSCHSLL